VSHRKKFILLLAKAFLTFGAPSHRVESQLFAASERLLIHASFAYIPGIIMVSFNDGETRTTELHFVRSSGRIALSALNNVHDVYRDVFDDRVSVQDGTSALDRILCAPPLYPLIVRCGLAFVCASVICPLAFGGSFIDMWVSGTCACILQYLGLQAAAKSSVYANVYEYVFVHPRCTTAHNLRQDICVHHRFFRCPVFEQHPRSSILLQLNLVRRGRLDSSWIHDMWVILFVYIPSMTG
jgi:uncharacterized membrane protein YjjP (DUF1212 family)